VSMHQVNPNKASKEKTKIMIPNDKNNAWFFQRLIKQSQLFETSHATAKPLSILSKSHQAWHAKA
jgi:hypothetical protein